MLTSMPEAPPFKIPRVRPRRHPSTPALQVLLIERADHPNYWQSVTGSLDSADEAWAEAARREVLETGFDAHAPGAVLRDWQLATSTRSTALAPPLRARRDAEHRACLWPVPAAGRHAAPQPARAHRLCLAALDRAADRCFSPSNAEAILQLPRYVPGASVPTR